METGKDNLGVSVVFFCYDNNGRVFLGKKLKNYGDEIGKWDIGYGELKLNESPIDTLKREVKKEYDTQILKYEFLGSRDVHRESGLERTLDFKVLVDGEKVRNGKPHKLNAIGWFTLKRMPSKEEMHPQLLEFLKKYKDRL